MSYSTKVGVRAKQMQGKGGGGVEEETPARMQTERGYVISNKQSNFSSQIRMLPFPIN